MLVSRGIETPLGSMVASATESALCMLEFADRRALPTQKGIVEKLVGPASDGTNAVLDSVEEELAAFFSGDLKRFATPIYFPGSEFQARVWKRLLEIPYGETLSYGQMAVELGFPDGQRAVGRANGENRIAIIIPCHRVIRSDGSLCGYGGGLWRKRKLLDLEAGQPALL